MKKKRLKKSVKLLFLLLIMIIIAILILCNKKDHNVEERKEKQEDIVERVYKKLNAENVSKEFISWINKNYPGSLVKLNKLIVEKKYDLTMWHEVTGYSYIVLNDLYTDKYKNMSNIKMIDSKEKSTLSFVGDVSLADNWFIAPKYDERGKGIEGVLSPEILKIMTNSDLMVANSEFTVSNRGVPLPNKLYTFRAKPERLSIYDEMGVDLVTLANNHVYDYGKDAFLDMLEAFEEYKIPHIGAGHNLEEAMKPYYFIINGYKFAFVSATRAEKYIMTPEATEDSEGVFRCYDTTNMVNLISSLRDNTDFVIALIHYGTEGSHQLEDVQISSSKEYIDAGADAVIGHHAHTLQGFEIYKDKPIVYNLGNFIFNDETIDTAIFQILLNSDGTMEYYIIPALQKNCYTDILIEQGKQKVIDDLISWSINVAIDENGKITQTIE